MVWRIARFRRGRTALWVGLGAVLAVITPLIAEPQPPLTIDAIGQRLTGAYPDAIASYETGKIKFRDGTSLSIDDGNGEKEFERWLDDPDIADMFQLAYVPGPMAGKPPKNFDPGRARNTALYEKLYGSCTSGEVERSLVSVAWLPSKVGGKGGGKITFNSRQGAAKALEAVVKELAPLPDRFTRFLVPAGGGYVCRPIAGTNRVSAHGYGIAIDIAVKTSHYWRWSKAGAGGEPVWQNAVPFEIVEIFERHGFIWGGKWYHYDTMHFEYRPELLAPSK